MQAEQLTANLTRAGVTCDEFVFSTAGANRLARALWGALRDHALDLPDEDETRSEFLSTRLVETGPGVVKIQNPPGSHDDIVTAVGMVVADLTERPDTGRGSITVPTGTPPRPHEPRRPAVAADDEARGWSGRPEGSAWFTGWGNRERARSVRRFANARERLRLRLTFP